MAEVHRHRLLDMEDAERQASEWIARLNADDVSGDDWTCFELWRASHQLHASAYNELVATWYVFTTAEPLVHAVVSFGQSVGLRPRFI
jgi:ferric-dicitrate binding protein FerR (iron transport regulator)